MVELLESSAYHFFSHSYCLSFMPLLVWNEAITSFLIFAAYTAMPVMFMTRSVRLRWPLWQWSLAFIGLCGIGHLFDILNLMSPNFYYLSAMVDIGTVLASVPAAYSLHLMVNEWRRLDSAA